MSEQRDSAKTIIFYTDAGGGHKAVSLALQSELSKRTRDKVIIVNIYEEIINRIDPLHRLMNLSGEKIFNKLILKRGIGRVFQYVFKYPALYLIKLNKEKIQREIISYLKIQNPGLVISTIPLMNRPISCSCSQLKIDMLTIVTDFGCSPGFEWVFKDQTHVALLPTPLAYQHAIAHQVKPCYLHVLPGLILKSDYYTASLSLQEKSQVPYKILVMMGAIGSSKFLSIAKSLNKVSHPIEVIFVCGRSQDLRTKMNAMTTRYKKSVEGFVNPIDYFKQADIFIGKPGPTCVTEALIMQTPMILEQNRFTMEQEHDVADFIEQNNFGITIKSFKNTHVALNQMLTNNHFNTIKKTIAQYNNSGLNAACNFIINIKSATH